MNRLGLRNGGVAANRMTRSRPSIGVCLAMLLLSCIPAWAPAAAFVESHSTKDGMHKGQIRAVGPVTGLDPKGYIFEIRISYCLWSIMGTPTEDYKFWWQWREGELPVGSYADGDRTIQVTTTSLAKYPDLLAQFYKLKPVDIQLRAGLWFDKLPGAIATADATKTFKPDLIAASGVAQDFSVPSGRDWWDFFDLKAPDAWIASPKLANLPDRAKWAKEDIGRINKTTFAASKRVYMSAPEIVSVDWGDATIKNLVDDYARREQQGKPKTPAASAEPNPLEKANPAKPAGPNPFEKADASATAKPNPLERGGRTAPVGGTPFTGITATRENPMEKAQRLERERRERDRLELERLARERAESDRAALEQRQEKDRIARERQQEEDRAARERQQENDRIVRQRQEDDARATRERQTDEKPNDGFVSVGDAIEQNRAAKEARAAQDAREEQQQNGNMMADMTSRMRETMGSAIQQPRPAILRDTDYSTRRSTDTVAPPARREEPAPSQSRRAPARSEREDADSPNRTARAGIREGYRRELARIEQQEEQARMERAKKFRGDHPYSIGDAAKAEEADWASYKKLYTDQKETIKGNCRTMLQRYPVSGDSNEP